MKISETNASAKTSLAAPFCVGRYDHFSALILVAVVNVELQLLAFVGLDEREKIFALVQD